MSRKHAVSQGDDPISRDLASSGNPSLANEQVIETLVRDFVTSVLRMKTGFQLGEEASREPLKAIEDLARAAGDVIMGRDSKYDAQQQWNHEWRGLGARLRVLLPTEVKHYGSAGTGLFMWLAVQALTASAALDAGDSEESVRTRLERVIEDVVARIIGTR